MLEGWKRAWREAVANFHHELSDGVDSPEAAAHRRALRREIATARGVLAQLDAEIRQTARQAAAERVSESDCRRRESLARSAGDAETEQLAVEYAQRHGERARVLERKVGVLQEERALLAGDVASMERLAPDVAADAAAGDAHGGRPGDAEFSRLQQDQRERTADARLEELKRRMR
jgi:hypothetical protein